MLLVQPLEQQPGSKREGASGQMHQTRAGEVEGGDQQTAVSEVSDKQLVYIERTTQVAKVANPPPPNKAHTARS
jgi:hypothetical protein